MPALADTPLPAIPVIGSEEQELHSRVHAEYREMPGLTLTLAQAARLFSIDLERCERVLGALVEGGVLATVRGGALTAGGCTFVRADGGRRYA